MALPGDLNRTELLRAALPVRLDAVRRAVEAGDQNAIGALARALGHLAAAAGDEGLVAAARAAQGGEEEAVRELVRAMRRSGRSRSGGGVLVVHPDAGQVSELVERTGSLVGSAHHVRTISEALEVLEQPEQSVCGVLLTAVFDWAEVMQLLDRVASDPALAHVPVVLCNAPEERRLGLLARGAFECFGSGAASDAVWDSMSTLVGFEGVGIELLPAHERLLPDRAAFQTAMRKVAERYLLDEGPEWCLALFRVTNFSYLEAGPAGALEDMTIAIGKAILERSPPSTLVGPLSSDEVGAVLFTHAPDGPAAALEDVRSEMGKHKLRGRTARPMLAGCVVHAGTASVPKVLGEARRLVGESSRSDAELRTNALSNDLRDLVLVVEDDDVFAALAERALDSLNLGMIRARTVGEALEIAGTESRSELCMMLLDVGLPDSSGFSLLDQLREDERLADVPAIFVSAHGSDRQVLEGLQHGADDYIVKPVAVQVLAARVRATLARGIRGSAKG